jgi:hypothetical protein
MQENEQALTAIALGCGESTTESFASYDPAMCSWKTSQLSLFGGWEEFSGTWPRAGTMLNGSVYRRPPLVPRISGTGSSFWPTPRYQERGSYQAKGDQAWLTLTGAVRLYPTPTAMNKTGGAALCKWGGSGARERLRQIISETEINGALNPMWVEWLMGFPLGWTDLED